MRYRCPPLSKKCRMAHYQILRSLGQLKFWVHPYSSSYLEIRSFVNILGNYPCTIHFLIILFAYLIGVLIFHDFLPVNFLGNYHIYQFYVYYIWGHSKLRTRKG